MPLQVPINLALDFDSTLTTTDTLVPLSGLAKPSSSSNANQTQEDPWKPFVDAWTADSNQHKDQYPQSATDRTTVDDEVAWQNSLAGLERASFERVRDSGLFAGLSFEDVQKGAEEAVTKGEVKFREGWEELIRFVLEWNQQFQGDQQPYLHIISVNFSAIWVWCCIQAAWRLTSSSPQKTSQDILPITIWANEATSISGDTTQSPAESTAKTYIHAKTPIHTSGQKLQIYKKDANTPKSMHIYLGDSPTDLQCLLSADLGILVRPPDEVRTPQKELREICERVGIPTPALKGLSESRLGQIMRSESSPGGKSLVCAEELGEVVEAVKGICRLGVLPLTEKGSER